MKVTAITPLPIKNSVNIELSNYEASILKWLFSRVRREMTNIATEHLKFVVDLEQELMRIV